MKDCPHGCGPLRWIDDQWMCPGCGDEWSEEALMSEDTAVGDVHFFAVLKGAERLTNSRNGNPVWRLHMAEGVTGIETAPDTAVGNEVENHVTGGPNNWVGKRVKFTTEAGRIIGWELAET